MKSAQSQFSEWRRANNQLLAGMFSGTCMWGKKDVADYVKSIVKNISVDQRRFLLDHSVLQNVIGRYFGMVGWNYRFEVPHGDLDSNYRFDIMAQKGVRTIVVEVKPQVTTRDMGQVIGYAYDVAKKYKKARVFLGTDILNFRTVFQGEIGNMIADKARDLRVGVIFASANQAWVLPAEFLLL